MKKKKVVAKKKKAKITKDSCRLITPEFRVSYPHLLKPQAPKKGDKLKYSITMLFPKDSELVGQTVDGKRRSIAFAIKAAKTLAFGKDESEWPEMGSPINDGDDSKYADKKGYKGHWILKAISNEDQKPGVVSKKGVPITEASDLYPGCYARAYVFAYVWEYMGKKGVGFILDHVQKLRDGEAFGGKKPVEQVFASIEDDDDESSADEDDDSKEEE